jgi:hypothetical protein
MNKKAFLIELSESDRTLFGRVDFGDQSKEQQVFSAIWELESLVNNGGFDQYFCSADGYTANCVAAALQRIGATKCADIVNRALRVVSPEPLPEDQAARQEIVEALGDAAQDALESLDQEFFVYPDNLTELLFLFVGSHPEVFGSVDTE